MTKSIRPTDNRAFLVALLNIAAEQKEDGHGQRVVPDSALRAVASPAYLADRLDIFPDLRKDVVRAVFEAMNGSDISFPPEFYDSLRPNVVAAHIEIALVSCNVSPGVIRNALQTDSLSKLLEEEKTWEFLSYKRSLANDPKALCATLQAILQFKLITPRELVTCVGIDWLVDALPPDILRAWCKTHLKNDTMETPAHVYTSADVLRIVTPEVLVANINRDHLYNEVVIFVARRQGFATSLEETPEEPSIPGPGAIPDLTGDPDPLAPSAPPPAPADDEPPIRGSEPPDADTDEDVTVISQKEEIEIPLPPEPPHVPRPEPVAHPTVPGLGVPPSSRRRNG